MMIQRQENSHYGAIDGLRSFAAIGIVMMHVQANVAYSLNGFFFERIVASFTDFVFLFMVISGFTMCCGYYDKIINREITLEEVAELSGYGNQYHLIRQFKEIMGQTPGQYRARKR